MVFLFETNIKTIKFKGHLCALSAQTSLCFLDTATLFVPTTPENRHFVPING